MKVVVSERSCVDTLRQALCRANIGDGEAMSVLLRVEILETGELVFTQQALSPQEWYGAWTFNLLDVFTLPIFYPEFEAVPGYWMIPALVSVSPDGIRIALTADPYRDPHSL